MELSSRTHIVVGYANPYFRCNTCGDKVLYWHDPVRCKCGDKVFNHPCYHTTGVTSQCLTWGPVDGCLCENKETHDA
jgi:hypothetical protein